MDKVDGEIFILKKTNLEQVIMSDDEINNKYKLGEIRLVTEQARYPIKNIPNMLNNVDNDYKLNPEYQRRKRWNNGKKSRLIESFIMNVPLPPIFLYEYEYSKFEVMDGLQRLTTIDDFYNNKFSLEGLEYWRELEGKRFNELPIEIQKGINRRFLSAIILLEETAKTPQQAEELKQIVFERLNSGGDELTHQETRNALHSGKFNKLCIKLAENNYFREMWNIPIPNNDNNVILLNNPLYRTMEDVELVLRFFAFRFLDEYTSSSSMKEFLDKYLLQANKFSNQTLQELENIFIETIELVYKIFGNDAFLLPKADERQSKRITKTIYEPLMQSMSKYINNKEKLFKNLELIRENKFSNELDFTIENGKKLFDGKYNHRSIIQKRIDYFDKLFKNYI